MERRLRGREDDVSWCSRKFIEGESDRRKVKKENYERELRLYSCRVSRDVPKVGSLRVRESPPLYPVVLRRATAARERAKVTN